MRGDGPQWRDFTYVNTVCAVIASAVCNQTDSVEPVNHVLDTDTIMYSLLKEIEGELGGPIARARTALHAGDMCASQAEISRVRELFPEVQPSGSRSGRTTLEGQLGHNRRTFCHSSTSTVFAGLAIHGNLKEVHRCTKYEKSNLLLGAYNAR